MRLASWVSLAISIVAVPLLTLRASTADDGTIRLVDAQFLQTQPTVLGPLPRTLGTLRADGWTAVQLPHVRRRTLLTRAVREQALLRDSVTAWYRLQIPPRIDAQALYLPRWYTWGRLAVYVDGQLVFSSVEERSAPSLNEMLLVRIPADHVTDLKPEQIVIRMDGVRVIGGLLSSVWVGPYAELQEKFAARRWLQVGIPQVSSATLLALGVFALFLWMARRRESSHLLFFLLAALYFLRNFRLFVEDWLLSERWSAWISVCSQGWLTVVTYMFALRFLDQRQPRVEKILMALMAGITLASLPVSVAQRSMAVWGGAAYLLFAIIRLGAAVSISIEARRVRSLEAWLLAGALWLSIAVGVYDWCVQTGRWNPEAVFLTSVGSLAVFAVFLFALLRRYGAALTEVEHANVRLQTTLAERERELERSYAQLRKTEHEQLLSNERQRLMREMHDGLGSALMSSLVAVERGQMRPTEIAQVLRECVDDLKLTIDSLDPAGDDLLVLLATLRYRLEPRLEAAGVQLIWEVREVPKLTWLNPSMALQILRMVQEVLTNVLKHAHARTIRVATQTDANHVAVLICDDGVGFDPQAARGAGRGLRNLQRRAEEIGGSLAIESRPGRTIAKILLPLERRRER